MKPFTAWLAMRSVGDPMTHPPFDAQPGNRYDVFSEEGTATYESPAPPQRVLIVADTPENRKKLGMEEG